MGRGAKTRAGQSAALGLFSRKTSEGARAPTSIFMKARKWSGAVNGLVGHTYAAVLWQGTLFNLGFVEFAHCPRNQAISTSSRVVVENDSRTMCHASDTVRAIKLQQIGKLTEARGALEAKPCPRWGRPSYSQILVRGRRKLESLLSRLWIPSFPKVYSSRLRSESWNKLEDGIFFHGTAQPLTWQAASGTPRSQVCKCTNQV